MILTYPMQTFKWVKGKGTFPEISLKSLIIEKYQRAETGKRTPFSKKPQHHLSIYNRNFSTWKDKWKLKMSYQKKYVFFSYFLHIHNFTLGFYVALSINTSMNLWEQYSVLKYMKCMTSDRFPWKRQKGVFTVAPYFDFQILF